MLRFRLFVPLLLLAAAGCATMKEVAALESVSFGLDHVSDVRLAGIRIGPGSSFGTLGASDAARLAAAVIEKQVPIDLVVHLTASNPAQNKVPARMTALDWGFFVENRQALAGQLASTVLLEPGKPADVPLTVRFDLLKFAGGGERDLFELALSIAGMGPVGKEVRVELRPTIETSIGPIHYPAPVVVKIAE